MGEAGLGCWPCSHRTRVASEVRLFHVAPADSALRETAVGFYCRFPGTLDGAEPEVVFPPLETTGCRKQCLRC